MKALTCTVALLFFPAAPVCASAPDGISLVQKELHAHAVADTMTSREISVDVAKQKALDAFVNGLRQMPFPMPDTMNISMSDVMAVGMALMKMFTNGTQYEALSASIDGTDKIMTEFAMNFTSETTKLSKAAGSADTPEAAFALLKHYGQVTLAAIKKALKEMLIGMTELGVVLKPTMDEVMDKMMPMVSGMLSGMSIPGLPAGMSMDPAMMTSMVESMTPDQMLNMIDMLALGKMRDIYSDEALFCKKMQGFWPNISKMSEAIDGQVIPMMSQVQEMLPSLSMMIETMNPEASPRVVAFLNSSMTQTRAQLQVMAPSVKMVLSTARDLIQEQMACKLHSGEKGGTTRTFLGPVTALAIAAMAWIGHHAV